MKGNFINLTVIILAVFLRTSVQAKLLAHFPFDGDANDCIGQHSKTVYGNPTYEDGQFGKAIRLDGKLDYIEIPEIGSDYGQFSYALWFKTDSYPEEFYSFISTHGLQEGYTHFLVGKNLEPDSQFPYRVEITICDDQELFLMHPIENFIGQWRHIACVFDGTSLKIYLDGRLLGMIGIAIPNQQMKLGSSLIGAWNASEKEYSTDIRRHFDGLFDDLVIFDNALSDADVLQHYSMGGASFILSKETKQILSKLKQIHSDSQTLPPLGAVNFLKEKILVFENWRKKNNEHYQLPFNHISLDPYWMLAKAKESAGAPRQELIEAYSKAAAGAAQQSNCVAALLWLHGKVPVKIYKEIVRKSVLKSDIKSFHLYYVVPFESAGNQDAFQLFLDAMFSTVQAPNIAAEIIAKGFSKDSKWYNDFLQYCRNNPSLREYVIKVDTAFAQDYSKREQYLQAAETYGRIVNECEAEQDKAFYQLKKYECLFQNGQYETAIQKLDGFIKQYKAAYPEHIIKAILLKGRACIQLGQIDKAIEMFQTVINKYPKQTRGQADFFVAYCSALQGRFEQAFQMFHKVIQDYPKSSYAIKARFMIKKTNEMKT
jgi:tetratricopeptide (TPR) repeat protein